MGTDKHAGVLSDWDPIKDGEMVFTPCSPPLYSFKIFIVCLFQDLQKAKSDVQEGNCVNSTPVHQGMIRK